MEISHIWTNKRKLAYKKKHNINAQEVFESKSGSYDKDVPDQNGPHTPGINNLFLETAMWQVEVPQTKTIRWHIASSLATEIEISST